MINTETILSLAESILTAIIIEHNSPFVAHTFSRLHLKNADKNLRYNLYYIIH